MIKATLIKDIGTIAETGARQKLYRLSQAVPSGYRDGPMTEYVVVSAVVAMFSGPETYIFAADAEGVVTNWLEMEGSYRGGLSHEAAIRGAGWTLDKAVPDGD